MNSFEGMIAVVTGGGSGMGRELVVQLAAAGCSVATCDVNPESTVTTVERADAVAPPGTHVTAHVCDVSDAAAVERFRDEVVDRHATQHVNLLFNNAGIGGGGSFLTAPREEWDRVFAVDWGGVYNCSRAFVPWLVASDDAYLVNVSSMNGFFASLGGAPHTAYSTAKFAVKGFTESLLVDFRRNAPHVKVAVVMPGHIGTDIMDNTRRYLGGSEPEHLRADELARTREMLATLGVQVDELDDDGVKGLVKAFSQGFRDSAPVTAAEAATTILDGVLAGEWRILVGDDARAVDEAVREDPVHAYDPDRFVLPNLPSEAQA